MDSSLIVAALGGATGLGALLTPILLHVSSRRQQTQVENTTLIDQLQQERDRSAERAEQLAAQVATLWDYVLRLRYAIVKGEPTPTMPDGLTVAAVRARTDP